MGTPRAPSECSPPPPDDKQVLQNLKRILVKVQEMRDQRLSLEQQLREMIQKDDITTSLVTADRSEMKVGSSRPSPSLPGVLGGLPAPPQLLPPPIFPRRNSSRSS